MEKNYNIEKIEAYVANRLDAAQRAEFEDEMVRDGGLETKVQRYALEREAVKLMLQDEYKSKIKGWLAGAAETNTGTEMVTTTADEIVTSSPMQPPAASIPQPEVPVIKLEPQGGERIPAEREVDAPPTETKVVKMGGWRRILSIAASVLVLVFAGAYFYASNQYTGDAIVNQNYLLAASAGDRSGQATASRELLNGQQAFFAEENDLAQAQLEGIQRGDTDYLAAQYYLGHIALREKDYQSANQIFTTLLGSQNLPNFINRDQLRYNQLLAMVGYGNTGAEFQRAVAELAENGTAPFNTKAAALRTKTESFWYGLIN